MHTRQADGILACFHNIFSPLSFLKQKMRSLNVELLTWNVRYEINANKELLDLQDVYCIHYISLGYTAAATAAVCREISPLPL